MSEPPITVLGADAPLTEVIRLLSTKAFILPEELSNGILFSSAAQLLVLTRLALAGTKRAPVPHVAVAVPCSATVASSYIPATEELPLGVGVPTPSVCQLPPEYTCFQVPTMKHSSPLAGEVYSLSLSVVLANVGHLNSQVNALSQEKVLSQVNVLFPEGLVLLLRWILLISALTISNGEWVRLLATTL